MPRRTERKRKTALAVAVLTAALTGSGAAAAADPATEAQAWRSAFERRQAVPLDERMIVVLAAPSLADRMAAPGKLSAKEQRRHVRRANALQVRLLAALRAQGIRVEREQVFTRTLNGFSARLGARAVAALESAPGVAGIYPVRAVYPASLSASALERPELLGRHGIALPGADGSGVTVAVLDTGVDRAHPSLRGRVLFGVDLVEGDTHAEPEPRPDDPTVVETHGTRVAGIVAGAGGPNGVSGVAPGAAGASDPRARLARRARAATRASGRETCCSEVWSAPSTPTATATSRTARSSPSRPSSSRTHRSRTARRAVRWRVRSPSARSSWRLPATTARRRTGAPGRSAPPGRPLRRSRWGPRIRARPW